MKLKTSFTIFILAVLLSGITGSLAESADRIAPTPPPTTAILGMIGSDFIIAGERKYMITSGTEIRGKRGNKISHRLLKVNSKLQIEFTIQTLDKKNVLVAGIIKVLSEP
jgi:hypothetical protein